MESDENVRRLEVAMNNPLLVSVLDSPADLEEQLEPLPGREMMTITKLRDLDARH